MAAVHRARLFAQHLPSFGWLPIILTVDEAYYEEPLDWDLYQLVPTDQQIEKVKALRVTKPRLIGDIGLRAFFQLRNRAVSLVKNEKIDFVYILIPSFYVSLIGNYIKQKTGIKYGIDYIDPWVHEFPGSDVKFSRHWWSTRLARWLEPKAVKNASLITGVAQSYYQGVQLRNPKLLETCKFGSMPYGGEVLDHIKLRDISTIEYLFKKNNKFQLAYAGALLPKAFEPLEAIFKSISLNTAIYTNIEFHFIGTGKTTHDLHGYSIKHLAEKYGLWQTIIFEYPQRIPYLNVLKHLQLADSIFILGSTEAHYTPSKTYQGVLSEKPIMAVLHIQSSAVNVLRSTQAGLVLDFNGADEIPVIENRFTDFMTEFISFCNNFSTGKVDKKYFEQFSAKNATAQLVDLINSI